MDISTIIILVVLALAAFAVIGIYNGIISRFNRAQRAWSDVLAYQRQKNEILPNLHSEASSFKEYESDLLQKVTELRSAINALPEDANGETLDMVQRKTRVLMDGLKVAVEAYPELASAGIVGKLMREMTRQEENVGAAITIFNRNVELFNNSIEMFPGSLINAKLNRKDRIEPFHDNKASDGIEYKFDGKSAA